MARVPRVEKCSSAHKHTHYSCYGLGPSQAVSVCMWAVGGVARHSSSSPRPVLRLRALLNLPLNPDYLDVQHALSLRRPVRRPRPG
jgi:hypothetical protein